jgi:hypothetical protein
MGEVISGALVLVGAHYHLRMIFRYKILFGKGGIFGHVSRL